MQLAGILHALRSPAHSLCPSEPPSLSPLQTAPGKYDEDVFRGLDTVIAEAERAGLRVILTFTDNWKYFGGVDEASGAGEAAV